MSKGGQRRGAAFHTLMLADGQRTRASWAAAWRWMLDQAGLSETFANSDPLQGSPLLPPGSAIQSHVKTTLRVATPPEAEGGCTARAQQGNSTRTFTCDLSYRASVGSGGGGRPSAVPACPCPAALAFCACSPTCWGRRHRLAEHSVLTAVTVCQAKQHATKAHLAQQRRT